MDELDTTKVANAYMRAMEDTIKTMVVNNALLQAKLTVALAEIETLRYATLKPPCATECENPDNCVCIRK